jgi:dihydrofolate reductase
MMGRFAYWMNVSLDLRIEQVPGDNGAGEWLRISEELHREFNAQARALALMVQGRVIYETMEEYWPRAREDASLPRGFPGMALKSGLSSIRRMPRAMRRC